MPLIETSVSFGSNAFVAIVITAIMVFLVLGTSSGDQFDLGSVQELIGDWAIPTEGWEYGTGEQVDEVSIELGFYPDDYFTTATEVGCRIAKAIRDDFTLYGYKDRQADTDLSVIWSRRKIIDQGDFSFEPTTSAEGDWKGFWHLELDYQFALAKSCSDTMPESADETNFHDYFVGCPRKLDEACVTYILSQLTFGKKGEDDPICDSEIWSTLDPVPHKFGNEKCGDSIYQGSNGQGWRESNIHGKADCNEWCDGSDRIKGFSAVGHETAESITMRRVPGFFDDGDDGYGLEQGLINNLKFNDPYMTLDTSQSTTVFVPQIADNDKIPRYKYVLYWDSKDHTYYVEILKIPKGKVLSRTDAKNDPEKLAEALYEYIHITEGTNSKMAMQNADGNYMVISKWNEINRDSYAGALIPELRMILNVTFKASKTVTLSKFSQLITPKGLDRRFETCGSEKTELQDIIDDCINPKQKVRLVKWSEFGQRDEFMGHPTEGTTADTGTNRYKEKSRGDRASGKEGDEHSLDTYWIYSPLGAEDDLKEGHKYQIIVTGWRSSTQYRSSWHDFDEGWFFDSNVMGGNNRHREYAKRQDMSTTIIELPRTCSSDSVCIAEEEKCIVGICKVS